MKIYILVLVLIFVIATFSRLISEKKTDKTNQFKSKILAFYIVIILSLLSGFRNGVGTDFYSYKSIFIDINNIKIEGNRDFGYYVLNKIVSYFSNNPQAIFLVTSFIINGLIIVTLYKYSKLFELSVYLYITTFMYFSSFNGIRQWLAAAILFSGVKYLINRDLKKYIIFILLASTMHQTALIMILVYFIVNHKFKSKRTLVTLMLGIIAFIVYQPLVGILMEILQDTKFGNDYKDVIGVLGNGANFLKFIVASVPVILSYVFYDSINRGNRKIDILMNLSLLNAIIMLVGTRHWIFARFLMYFEIYNLLLYPVVILNISKKDIKIIYYLLLVFYLVFCILILMSGDSNIVPYRVNLDLLR